MEVAEEKGIIKPEEKEILGQWRVNPSGWGR
jgi:hypothetical protein